MTQSISAYVSAIKLEADGVLLFEIKRAGGGALPEFSAGAHIEIYLKDGLSRCYSLLNDPANSETYEIAVAKSANSRGGSKFIHENLRCGQRVDISTPRNNFQLFEKASRSILIAGGIGITPLWSMAQRLSALGKTWELHYIARNAEKAALYDEISRKRLPGTIYFHFTKGTGSSRKYLKDLLERDDGESHLYCCGPSGMIESFLHHTQSLPAERVHFEFFSAQKEVSTDGGFHVELAKSGKTIIVDRGKTILDTLLENDIAIMNSCREGICGACEVKLIDGQADHRDSILSDDEKKANKSIFVCCSGSQGGKLVLDI